MSSHRTLTLLAALAISGAASAQEATPPAGPVLTDQQVNNVLQQLKDLEKTIETQRGGSLAAIIKKLSGGASSDAAAMNLYIECDKLVNVERKEGDKGQARQRQDQVERQTDGRGGAYAQDEGDFGAAVKLQLQYLVLTLEANETADREKLLPKLAAYLQDVVANAKKLKGRAGRYLATGLRGGGGGGPRGGGGGGARFGGGGGEANPFVPAYQLDRFLELEGWSLNPLDFQQIWDVAILPYYRDKKKAELATQWDNRINAETNFRKEAMYEPEFLLWQQNELPPVRWERARDLFTNSDKPITGMAEMLAIIKANPSHAEAVRWLEELRGLVAKTSPGANSEPGVETENPAGTSQ